MPNKILIDVQGGLVQGVFSNCDIEVCLIDWDNIKDGGQIDMVDSDNYGTVVVTDQELEEKMEEANEIVKENIDDDVEQRR